ncbi:fatty acid hydroxylase [Arenicella chitinivorans]|uniref:Fatty acid hydroxylase n=1 Tax=Arenicella chitinivorans TaxID=1329800 RepID=A0A918RHE4_9GAMM|nr:sterol desaturase family protein [Arenicella chitinivorans]GGZ96378.1 fatty acid hydroxylase [Arenicella chitinivorans]
MKPELVIIVAIFSGFILLEIALTQFFHKPGQTRSDALVESISTGVLMFITQPLAIAGGMGVAALLAPDWHNAIANWHWLAVFGLFLIFDDMLQYWWHRLSHTVPWLYNLHRPHHNAAYLSIRVVYRNNVFYYLLMPGLWFSGALLYFGGAHVYAIYLVIKMTVIFAAHSDVRWDRSLYQIRGLSPLMWLLERIISTPATHSAHHGKHAADGVTHYKGNYGNLLFLWDVLFGTAKITRRYPDEFGVENLPDTSTAEQLLWPLIKQSTDKPTT